MRILVYGAGGIGLYFAGRLAQRGHAVTLKGRASTVEAAADGPLRLQTEKGVEEIRGVQVVDDCALGRAEEGAAEGFDLVVLATKTWQVSAAVVEVAAHLNAGGLVLTTQNGISAPADAARAVAPHRVLAGAVVVIAQRTAPMEVKLVGAEASLTLGCPEGSEPAGAPAVVEALSGAGIATTWTDDITSALWKKLALIASYGGVGALGRATVGEMREVPETADLVRRALAEAVEVGNLCGARLSAADVDDLMRIFAQGFSGDTTASLQRDLAQGLPSELAHQSGAVVRAAEAAGADAPIHRTIYAALLPQEPAEHRARLRAMLA